jgi:hypothetical protein
LIVLAGFLFAIVSFYLYSMRNIQNRNQLDWLLLCRIDQQKYMESRWNYLSDFKLLRISKNPRENKSVTTAAKKGMRSVIFLVLN